MAVSSGIAIAGIGLAWYFWIRNRRLADSIARSSRGPTSCCSTSTYVDELYDAAIVQPIKLLSTGRLWKGVDAA